MHTEPQRMSYLSVHQKLHHLVMSLPNRYILPFYLCASPEGPYSGVTQYRCEILHGGDQFRAFSPHIRRKGSHLRGMCVVVAPCGARSNRLLPRKFVLEAPGARVFLGPPRVLVHPFQPPLAL